MKKENGETIKVEKLNWISILLIVIASLLIVFSFFAPYLFTVLKSGIEFPKDNIIGDTIGGIMNPFIALAGVLATFLAFYIQYKANRLQQTQFYHQLYEQKIQFKKSQLESQFYEMLRLHKENVNEMLITGYDVEKIISSDGPVMGGSITSFNKTVTTQAKERQIQGRKLFVAMKTELEAIFEFYKKYMSTFDENSLKICYRVFFFGLDYVSEEPSLKEKFAVLFSKLRDARIAHEQSVGEKKIYEGIKIYIKYKPFSGHQSRLAHYYRHLFLTVKLIAKQEESFITYEEKRNYLRTLRAQLSNHEQALLFYNWRSEFGGQWESDINKFFTDYRMIHNLYQGLITNDFKLEGIFDINGSYRKEKGRDYDPLFEYQDLNFTPL